MRLPPALGTSPAPAEGAQLHRTAALSSMVLAAAQPHPPPSTLTDALQRASLAASLAAHSPGAGVGSTAPSVPAYASPRITRLRSRSHSPAAVLLDGSAAVPVAAAESMASPGARMREASRMADRQTQLLAQRESELANAIRECASLRTRIATWKEEQTRHAALLLENEQLKASLSRCERIRRDQLAYIQLLHSQLALLQNREEEGRSALLQSPSKSSHNAATSNETALVLPPASPQRFLADRPQMSAPSVQLQGRTPIDELSQRPSHSNSQPQSQVHPHPHPQLSHPRYAPTESSGQRLPSEDEEGDFDDEHEEARAETRARTINSMSSRHPTDWSSQAQSQTRTRHSLPVAAPGSATSLRSSAATAGSSRAHPYGSSSSSSSRRGASHKSSMSASKSSASSRPRSQMHDSTSNGNGARAASNKPDRPGTTSVQATPRRTSSHSVSRPLSASALLRSSSTHTRRPNPPMR
jgi:hypothetical protein